MRAVLLDGLWGAAWRLRWMQRHLRQAGIPRVDIFSYNSSGLIPLEVLADDLAAFLGSEPTWVVAHSMGGIITRLAQLRHPELALKATAFLCVPHHGTRVAHALPFPGVRQLRPASPLLQELAGQRWPIPTLTVWCSGDLVIVPRSSARWSEADHEVCCRVPLHNWPVMSPRFHRLIARFFLTPTTFTT